MAHLLENFKLHNLWKRALSALVLGPLVLGMICVGGWLFQAGMVLGALLGAREWARMIAPNAVNRPLLLVGGGIFLVFSLYLLAGPLPALLAALTLAALSGLAPGVSVWSNVGGCDRWWLALGIPYVGIGAVALMWLREYPRIGLGLIVFLFLTVWANDIGAYIFGKSIGGPRLAPTISPAKTWAGFHGGVATAGLVGGLTALLFGAREPLVAVGLGALLGVVGQVGDLFESAVKRRYNVKDSGCLIPGHGGLLDRIDGLIAAAPVLALFQTVWGAICGAELGWW
ncbi:MAG: phosphatidate cytidylyltransferase [Rhodospirillaceae bacterium]